MLHHLQADVGVKDLEIEMHDPINEASYYRITGKINKKDAAELTNAIVGLNGSLRHFVIFGSLFDVEWFAEGENEFNM